MNATLPDTDRARLDQWLWAARWFKTRELAAEACERGRVHVNDAPAKPAKALRIGDSVDLQIERGRFRVEVLALGTQRKSASLAQALYRETEASRLAREQAAELRRLSPEPEATRHGRPTKQERRALQRLRDGA
nr:RNA-binding S4 domain-containing protein [Thiomonas sp.]